MNGQHGRFCMTPSRKRLVSAEVSTVLIALAWFFEESDLRFYHNGITSLLFGILATTVLAMPSWGMAGVLKRALRLPETSRIAIVAVLWLCLFLAIFLATPKDKSGSPSPIDVLRMGLSFWLVSLTYGIPALLIHSWYPDKPEPSPPEHWTEES